MKTLQLKILAVDYSGDDVTKMNQERKLRNQPELPTKFDYRRTIMDLLKQPIDPTKGLTFEEQAEAMPIWIKLRNHEMPELGNSEIQLEDAEYKFIVERCTKGNQLIQASLELYLMAEDIKGAKDHLQEVK